MMRDGCTVLDLSCGDGFYPFYFYSHRASHVDAVDIDRAAIRHATRYHALENIVYYTADITSWSFPREKYDVICWNGAPGHFNGAEILEVLQQCRRHLAEDGVLCGYEVIETEEQRTWDHKVAFVTSDRLRELLSTAFPAVRLYSFEGHGYLNAYFRCGFDLERLTTFG